MIYTKNGFEIKQLLKKDKDWGINMAFNTLTCLLLFVVIFILYYISHIFLKSNQLLRFYYKKMYISFVLIKYF